jgi:Icc-related predicted phosphoesterase
MIRIAAVGDLHFGEDSAGSLAPRLRDLVDRADLLTVAGDLTRCGSRSEAEILAGDLVGVDVPIVAVLGNHDFHGDCPNEVAEVMAAVGVHVLDGDAVVIDVRGLQVGVAGVKGFGGGFPGASGSDFGEPEMKAFMRASESSADRLMSGLRTLNSVDVRVALTHYAPVPETLQGEHLEIYPFLGSSYLAEAIDGGRADLALHGHAHRGSEQGTTPGGTPVRNVAQPVIAAPYRVYRMETESTSSGSLKGTASSSVHKRQ